MCHLLPVSSQNLLGDFFFANGAMIASAANAGQIAVMDYVYKNIAIILTDDENHRTATQYEDALIAKVRRRTATGRSLCLGAAV